jgi:hypothetical protein
VVWAPWLLYFGAACCCRRVNVDMTEVDVVD